jgi:acylphosphatase
MKRKIIIDVFGRVQGVFFRSTTRKKAQKWGLKGYVKNMPDGSVHIEAEGSEDKLEKLLKFAHNGPSFARVDRVESKYEEATNEFKRFRVSF